jgi:hypothetical protein
MSLMKCIQTHTHVLDYNAGSLLEVFVEIKIQKAIVYCFAGIHKYASVRHIVCLSPKFSHQNSKYCLVGQGRPWCHNPPPGISFMSAP